MEILRKRDLGLLREKLGTFPVVGILGPRQCGKTTLAHQFARSHPPSKIHFFDLEDPRDVMRLENPMVALESLDGIVILDEIQRRAELFPVLRVLVDRRPSTKYILLGSASRDLIAQSSETLAGRIGYMELGGFSLGLVDLVEQNKLWLRGGFPRSFLAKGSKASFEWREAFIRTFLERDIPNFGIHIPPRILRRFWMMLAHYHGQLFNASEIAKSLQLSDTTARRYLDILTGTFMIRQLTPWFYNTKKRLIKAPKTYFRDSGLFHSLLSIEEWANLQRHPKLGASWEGFALEQIISQMGLKEEETFFWGIHGGAELDLFFQQKGRHWGIEVKYKDAPSRTRSMQSAIEELGLEHLWVVYPGDKLYFLAKNISVVPLSELEKIRIS